MYIFRSGRVIACVTAIEIELDLNKWLTRSWVLFPHFLSTRSIWFRLKIRMLLLPVVSKPVVDSISLSTPKDHLNNYPTILLVVIFVCLCSVDWQWFFVLLCLVGSCICLSVWQGHSCVQLSWSFESKIVDRLEKKARVSEGDVQLALRCGYTIIITAVEN